MHREVHKYLDGELPRNALSPEAEAELKEWESLEHTVAEPRDAQVPPWFADDVMRALPQPSVAPWRRAWRWLVTPRPMRIPPFAPLAFTAAILFVVLLPRPGAPRDTPVAPPSAADRANAPVIYVQFALTAEGAHSVSVAGDFNDWSADTGALRDPDGDGVWSGLVAVKPGMHKYMFVVNGEEWVTDPVADSYVDDEFGMRNALLAVTAPEATTS